MTPTYVCRDDEGNHFVYIGEDTFTRLPEGEQKEHWMKKLGEGKVTIHEIAGCVIYDVDTGEETVRLADGWEIEP